MGVDEVDFHRDGRSSSAAKKLAADFGTIGRTVLDRLMPARRLRVSPRAVKRPLSRYAYKSLRVDRRTYQATIEINILTPADSP
ncbi:hypothetical protein [Actinoplanes siamensis]|uniref:hypothetical protein n=1 Tax=Actinoplanes siamensis TaxID=1223317 RepID=UPI00366E4244